MTPDGAFDRRLTTWLEEDAAPRAPQGFDALVAESVNQKRQLPSWATPERWISMETQARLGVMPRAVILALTISLLIAGLAVSLALAGSLTNADDRAVGNGIVAYTGEDGQIWAQDPDSAELPVRLTTSGHGNGGMEWAPDGTRFSFESSEEDGPAVIAIGWLDGRDPVIVSEPFDEVYGHAWSPDSQTLLFAGATEPESPPERCNVRADLCGFGIYSAPGDGSRPAARITDADLDAINPVWAPDGSTIIFMGSGDGGVHDRHLYRMDPDGGKVAPVGELTGRHEWTLLTSDVSPDGGKLVTQAGDGSVHLFLMDLKDGTVTPLPALEGYEEFEARWSPDGGRIVFNQSRVGTWNPRTAMYDVATGQVEVLDESLRVLGWSPDGMQLYGQDEGKVGLLDVSADAPDDAEVVFLEGSRDGDPGWQPLP